MKTELDTPSDPLEDDDLEYLFVERRLNNRRKSLPHAPFLPGLRIDRRWSEDRRESTADAGLFFCQPKRLN